ncbi:hypothetical protein pmac_cds_516 [Pandoravirus macleodensis]|uniref:Uncharacterized protein n=1 Tax=Pandoravirus macleodensis TaxID=2107707 RepID=A0A2U7UFI0_9VIRU|nr:hypothetical protein pmac_cds_516 [Pandoravirus macleodensis]AVK77204.1 hypothetical protein pmac_cds_516 [Pandoravirus macleodensis]
MRRRRSDDALWGQGARLCAAARSGAVLGPQDAALLDQIAREAAPGVCVSTTLPQSPCDVLAAAAGSDWVREVDTWVDRLRWSLPGAPAASGTPIGYEPMAKRPRIDAGSTGALLGPNETAGPTAPMMPTYRPVRVPARPPLAVLRAMLPGVPEALLPYVALPDDVDVAPHTVDPDTTTIARRPPLFDVGRATRPTALPDDMDIPPSTDPLVESDSAPYQERVPFDVQDLIMRRLIETDPQSALALAGTSTRQASLLADRIERARQRAAAQSLADFGQPTGAIGDYLRARTAFGGDPRDAPLAIALCLMEAFVRFLFAHHWAIGSASQSTQEIDTEKDTRQDAAGGDGRSPPREGDHSFNYGSHLVDQVAADPRLGTLRDRARAWYQWIETPGRELSPGEPGANRGPVQVLMEEYASPGKPYNGPLAEPLRTPIAVATDGEREGPARGQFQPLAVFWAPRHTRTTHKVRQLIDDGRWGRTHGEAWEWARHSMGAYPDEFINAGVRQYLRGPCALVARGTPLAMPDFTSVFNVQFAFRPGTVRDMLYARMASPAIERLLA